MLLLAGLVAVLTFASACGDGGDGTPSAKPTPTPTAERGGTAAEPPAARTPGPGVAWTYATVMRRLGGQRIRVDGEVVRIDRRTVTCGGVGAPATRVRGELAWSRHRCVQTTFTAAGQVGPDAVFVVEPTGARSFVTTEAEFTTY